MLVLPINTQLNTFIRGIFLSELQVTRAAITKKAFLWLPYYRKSFSQTTPGYYYRRNSSFLISFTYLAISLIFK